MLLEVTPEEMTAFRRSWGCVRALLVVDPTVMPRSADIWAIAVQLRAVRETPGRSHGGLAWPGFGTEKTKAKLHT